jgi:hypothetical protein
MYFENNNYYCDYSSYCLITECLFYDLIKGSCNRSDRKLHIESYSRYLLFDFVPSHKVSNNCVLYLIKSSYTCVTMTVEVLYHI